MIRIRKPLGLAALSALVCAGLTAAAPASAQQTRVIDRTGPYGGTITGEATRGAGYATRDITRAGPNGGVYERSAGCVRGAWRGGCGSSSTYTTPGGETYTGRSAAGRGPFRAGRAGVVTGSEGGRRAYARGVGPRGGWARRWAR
ncbi:MAG: hypothetical protein AAFW46_04245 [Pseudomonadota bacterium]